MGIKAHALHEVACREGKAHYTDPHSGYCVFTAVGLSKRGRCCGSGCRHCPYGHREIPLGQRPALIHEPAWLTLAPPTDEPMDVLFWSGGKDSLLALRAIQREGGKRIILLTTFDQGSRTVPHQEVGIELIARQAKFLKLPLLGVPLLLGVPYVERLVAGLSLVAAVERFVFGDLHLEHIRDWRVEALSEVARKWSASFHFPLWQVPYEKLLEDLEASSVLCTVSATAAPVEGVIHVGDVFDRALLSRLPRGVDAFGECGEFHTLARVWHSSNGHG